MKSYVIGLNMISILNPQNEWRNRLSWCSSRFPISLETNYLTMQLKYRQKNYWINHWNWKRSINFIPDNNTNVWNLRSKNEPLYKYSHPEEMTHFSENFWVFVVLEFKETRLWLGTAPVYLVYRYWRNVGKKENKYSRSPLIRKMVIRISNNPDRLGNSCKLVQNSTKLTCLEITGNQIKYSTVLWLLELQIRRGR